MKPRILLLDVETYPDVVYTWGVYEQNAIAVKEHWYILNYAARWYGQGPVICRGLDDMPPGTHDRALVREIHKLLDEADIVIAHNGIDFDIRRINARLIAHGFTPPAPYKVVDTKRAIKQVAGFSSNKLDWLCKQLSLGKKLEHEGFPLWQKCAEQNDPAAWRKMKRYNRHDIVLLTELYNTISPWIKQPSFVAYEGGERCVSLSCGSEDLQWRGLQRTQTRTYRRFQCKKCRKWGQAVRAEQTPRALTKPV